MANMKQLTIILNVCRKAGLPVMIEGSYGVGKTSAAYQSWTTARKELNQWIPDGTIDTLSRRQLSQFSHPAPGEYGFWSVGAQNLTIEEAIGYPSVDRDRRILEYLRCGNFIPPANHTGGGVWVVDEINLADQSIERALMAIALEGVFLDYILPDNIFIVTSQNPPINGYHSRRLNPPTVDRFVKVWLKVEHNEVIDRFLLTGVDEDIVDFLTVNSEALNTHQKEMDSVDKDEKRSASSRGWAFVNKMMAQLKDPEILKRVGFELVSGCVGPAAAGNFIQMLKNPERKDLVIPGIDIMSGYGVDKEVLTEGYDSFTKYTEVRNKVRRSSRGSRVRIDVLNRALRESAAILAKDADDIYMAMGGKESIKSMNSIQILTKARAFATDEMRQRWMNMMVFMCDCPADMVETHFLSTVLTNDVTRVTLSALSSSTGRRSRLVGDWIDHIDGKRKTDRFMIVADNEGERDAAE